MDPDRRITDMDMWKALLSAGIIQADDKIRKITIEVEAGKPVILHVERYADERLLGVINSRFEIYDDKGRAQLKVVGQKWKDPDGSAAAGA